jgi:hypothetical protein
MDNQQKISALIEADFEIQQMRQQITAFRSAETSARIAAIKAANAVPALLRAADASRQTMWKLEGVEGEPSETLDKYTGDCADCWFQNWSQSEDEAENAALDQCARAATLRNKWRKVEAQGEALQLAHNQRVDQLRRDFWRQELAETKAETVEA